MSEAIKRDNPFVDLPTSIFLTTEGLTLFSKNPAQLKRVNNIKGVPHQGISSDRYNALLVQKMVLNSYVDEIYVREPNLLQYRSDIISTNNLIVYAILYKKLSPSLADMMFQSPVVKIYNRKNPKYAITELSKISKERVEKLESEQAQFFSEMKQEIYNEVVRRIEESRMTSEEDKRTRVRSLDKFIAWIDKRIWYLYLIIYKTPLKKEMLHSFSSMISIYLARTQLATHLSNLLMEFVQNAEKAHFERIIVRGRYAPLTAVNAFMRDRENREQVVNAARKQNQMLELAWNMNPETISVGQQYRIAITISNYGIISDDVRLKLSKKMRTNVDGISLAGFYEESGDEKLGAGLGLLYNSYLEDLCRDEGIYYKCNIYPEPDNEKTTVKLEVVL